MMSNSRSPLHPSRILNQRWGKFFFDGKLGCWGGFSFVANFRADTLFPQILPHYFPSWVCCSHFASIALTFACIWVFNGVLGSLVLMGLWGILGKGWINSSSKTLAPQIPKPKSLFASMGHLPPEINGKGLSHHYQCPRNDLLPVGAGNPL